jgi:hypothetical protein
LTVFFTLLGSASIKAVCRTLMKLSPGVNFINILCSALTLVDLKSVKSTAKSYKYLFTLSGSASVKAVPRMLMKLSPGVKFINILCTAFTLVDPKSVKSTAKS